MSVDIVGAYGQLVTATTRWPSFSSTAFAIGLHTKSPVEPSAFLRGVQVLGRKFPSLTDARYDEEEKKLTLRDEESEASRQQLLTGTNGNSFEYAWGSAANLNVEAVVSTFISALEEAFGIVPINVSLIDFRCAVASDWAGNHYAAIVRAFYGSSPLATAIGEEEVLQADVALLRTVGEPDSRAVINITSTQSEQKILKQDFSRSLLRTQLGVARTKIPFQAALADVALANLGVAIAFALRYFVPAVVQPLDEIIQSIATKTEVANG